jgi:hypothetical protein
MNLNHVGIERRERRSKFKILAKGLLGAYLRLQNRSGGGKHSIR